MRSSARRLLLGCAAAAGTWRVHDTERDAMGNAVDQCDSGAVRFTAQR